MSKAVKDRMIKELSGRYRNVANWLVVNYRGLNAQQASNLRIYLRTNGIRMNVAKNAVARFTFKEMGRDDAGKLVDGPIALIYSEPKGKSDDPVGLSKLVMGWRDKNPQEAKMLLIRGGYLEGRLVSSEQVVQFARVPSREVLLSQLAGVFKAPMSRLAYALNALPQKMAGTMKALADKQESNKA